MQNFLFPTWCSSGWLGDGYVGLLCLLTILINMRLLQSKCKPTTPSLCYSGVQIRQLWDCKKGQLQLVLAVVCSNPDRTSGWSQRDIPFIHHSPASVKWWGTICAGAVHCHCFYSRWKYCTVLPVCYCHKHEIHSACSFVEELNWRDPLPKVGNVTLWHCTL